MNKQLIIPCSRMTLVMDESELIGKLSADLLQTSMKKGKRYLRAQAAAKRNGAGFDRWTLYETLKGNRRIDDVIIKAVESMPVTELREGVIEYLMIRNKQ